ncbi:hypothetical protein LINPERHAP2_LOCUS5989 [Linum perenne]
MVGCSALTDIIGKGDLAHVIDADAIVLDDAQNPVIMSFSCFRIGTYKALPPELHLRLLHAWKLGQPANPEQFFAYGTFWTNAEGTRVQGDSHHNFAAILQKRIDVGSVYKISSYSITLPCPSFRSCSFPHCLSITAATKFALQPPTTPHFLNNSFEFVPFAKLPSRMPPCAYLTDIIGKVIGVGYPNHVDNGASIVPVQNLVIITPSGLEVEVSLWGDLAHVIDADSIVLDDAQNPVIMSFSCFRIGTYKAATKFALQPPTTPHFLTNSFEFVPFAKLPSRMPPCAYLTDIIGKVIGVGYPNHVDNGASIVPVQNLVIITPSGLEVEVSLWGDLAHVIDADSIVLDDAQNPVIMSFSCFRIGTYKALPPELHLRLLHAWKLGHPANPEQFFAYGTLWTDAEGTRVQGDSQRNFVAILQKRIDVGSVYKISSYSITLPCPSFRSCSFPHCLSITAATKFALQPPTTPPFLADSFEFVPFAKLPSRMPPCAYLKDIIGKVIGVGYPNHVDNGASIAPLQNLVIITPRFLSFLFMQLCLHFFFPCTDLPQMSHFHVPPLSFIPVCSGLEVEVSLWGDPAHIIDADSIVLDDAQNSVIMSFSCFRIGTYKGKPNAYSCPASRILLQPELPRFRRHSHHPLDYFGFLVLSPDLLMSTMLPSTVAFFPFSNSHFLLFSPTHFFSASFYSILHLFRKLLSPEQLCLMFCSDTFLLKLSRLNFTSVCCMRGSSDTQQIQNSFSHMELCELMLSCDKVCPPASYDTPFLADSFEFVPFAKLPSRMSPCAYLTDIIGKVIGVGYPNHVDNGASIAPVQNLVIINPSGIEVEVSLWDDLAHVIDADAIVLDDAQNPVIMSFSCFRIGTYKAATKFALQPPTTPPFLADSFEFVPFAKLPSRMPPCAYLTDIIGKVIGVGYPNHVDNGASITPVQNLVIINPRFLSFLFMQLCLHFFFPCTDLQQMSHFHVPPLSFIPVCSALPPELHLRLLHAWKLGHPANPEQFFAYGTLWTDAEGTRVQGDSHRNFAAILQKRIDVGSVYKISSYSITLPCPSFRSCSFPHCLSITAARKFALQPPTTPPVLADSFEFVPFAKLPSRMPPCAYLTDIIGKVIGVGYPNHVDNGASIAPVQNLVIINPSGLEVEVSLWGDLAHVIDADAIVLDDAQNPVIMFFSCFRIGTYKGTTLSVHSDHHRYRLKLNVRDSTAEATFVLLGMTADKIMPISAIELARVTRMPTVTYLHQSSSSKNRNHASVTAEPLSSVAAPPRTKPPTPSPTPGPTPIVRIITPLAKVKQECSDTPGGYSFSAPCDQQPAAQTRTYVCKRLFKS